MAFADIIDGTVPVEIGFAGSIITAHVYTAGIKRLRPADFGLFERLQGELQPLSERLVELEAEANALNGDESERAEQIRRALSETHREVNRATLSMATEMLPLMIAKWEEDGEPLMYPAGQECLLTKDNLATLPVEFVSTSFRATYDTWSGSQKKEPSPDGSPPEDKPANFQVENISPSSD